jgi:hypothetical protein
VECLLDGARDFAAVRSNEICCTVNHVPVCKLVANLERDDLFCNRLRDEVKLNNFAVPCGFFMRNVVGRKP